MRLIAFRGAVLVCASTVWLASVASSVVSGFSRTTSSTSVGQTSTPPTLPILVYHEIRVSGPEPADGPTAISLERFEAEMRELKAQGYTTLSMDEVVRFLKGDRFPEKVVAVHLDDGWKSGLSAVPVLNQLGFKATFWIISGTGITWPHFDWAEIETIAANPRFDLYSHTLTHPWKPNETLPDWLADKTPGKGAEDVRRELTESKRILEEKLRRPVPYLAWPSGFYNDRLIAMAQEAGYQALLTIDDGVNSPGDSLLRVRRTMVHGACGLDVFREMLRDGKARDCSPAPAAAPR